MTPTARNADDDFFSATSAVYAPVVAGDDEDFSLATYAAYAPVTGERKLNINLQNQLPKPYLARALVAVDPEHPKGTEGKDNRNMSVLQQHVAFFDKNNDGIVHPWESYHGFRAIGCGILVSLGLTILIHLLFSYPTLPGWIPSPLFPIYISNIHKDKHGSDSETYDTEGRFDPSKFDAIFSKYALRNPDALSSEEVNTMLRGNRNVLDIVGGLVAILEWRLLYSLGKDGEGLLHRETVRGLFDGSLFEELEKKNSHGKRA